MTWFKSTAAHINNYCDNIEANDAAQPGMPVYPAMGPGARPVVYGTERRPRRQGELYDPTKARQNQQQSKRQQQGIPLSVLLVFETGETTFLAQF